MAHVLKCAFKDLNLFSWFTMGEQKLAHLRLITDDADSGPLNINSNSIKRNMRMRMRN